MILTMSFFSAAKPVENNSVCSLKAAHENAAILTFILTLAFR
jgi:hypothetical protein